MAGRKSAWLAVLAVTACNVFETRTFFPVAEKTVRFGLLPGAGEAQTYRYQEFLRVPGSGNLRDTLIGEGTLRLTALDTISAGPSLAGVRLFERVTLGSGTLSRRQDTVALAVGDDGFLLAGQTPVGGGFLPAPAGDSSAAAVPAEGWTLLPPGLETGNRWRLSQGDALCERRVSGQDTLPVGSALHQSWRIDESVSLQGTEVSQARYWFSEKGLLRAEWQWQGLTLTTELAQEQGQVGYLRVLRRVF